MATVKILHSETTGHVPASLTPGQIAINSTDGIIFWTADGTTIQSFNFKTPLVPTQAETDNTTKAASTAMVQSVAALLYGTVAGGAPNTIGELAAAINNDPDYWQTINGQITNRIRYDAAQSLSSTQLAQVISNIGLSGALRFDTAQSLTSPQLAQVQGNIGLTAALAGISLPVSGIVNKFRNPGFDIAQRGTTGLAVPGSLTYSLDGWLLEPTGWTDNWTQVYNDHISGNSILLGGNPSVVTAHTLSQRLESYVAQQLLKPNGTAQPITVQFTIYNNLGTTITPSLSTSYPTGTGQDNWSTSATDLSSVNLQSIFNGATATVAYTFVPNVAMMNGYQITLKLPGSNSSLITVGVGCADVRATPGVTTGVNNSPPPPELISPALELLRCQRYFYSKYSAVADSSYCLGFCDTTTNARLLLQLPVLMRGNSLVLTTNGSFRVRVAGGTAADVTALGVSLATQLDAIDLNASVASGLTTGFPCYLQDDGSNNSWIQVSAEL